MGGSSHRLKFVDPNLCEWYFGLSWTMSAPIWNPQVRVFRSSVRNEHVVHCGSWASCIFRCICAWDEHQRHYIQTFAKDLHGRVGMKKDAKCETRLQCTCAAIFTSYSCCSLVLTCMHVWSCHIHSWHELVRYNDHVHICNPGKM
jgi:hypothetical protein